MADWRSRRRNVWLGEAGVSDGQGLRRIGKDIPMSAYLGVLRDAGDDGMVWRTSDSETGRRKDGGHFVSQRCRWRNSGAAGQKAWLPCGGYCWQTEKCAYVEQTLGFDVCIDYKQADWKTALALIRAGWYRCWFENVGGEIFDASLARINPFGQIALCGMISGYNGEISIRNSRALLTMRLMVQVSL
jgi:hypothetical protein